MKKMVPSFNVKIVLSKRNKKAVGGNRLIFLPFNKNYKIKVFEKKK